MNLTRLALSNPVAVVAAILMVLLMGTIGLASLPIQMIPDVQQPFIQINQRRCRRLPIVAFAHRPRACFAKAPSHLGLLQR